MRRGYVLCPFPFLLVLQLCGISAVIVTAMFAFSAIFFRTNRVPQSHAAVLENTDRFEHVWKVMNNFSLFGVPEEKKQECFLSFLQENIAPCIPNDPRLVLVPATKKGKNQEHGYPHATFMIHEKMFWSTFGMLTAITPEDMMRAVLRFTFFFEMNRDFLVVMDFRYAAQESDSIFLTLAYLLAQNEDETLVITQNRTGGTERKSRLSIPLMNGYMPMIPSGIFRNFRFIVLIGKKSPPAGEMIARLIRYRGQGIIVGEPTLHGNVREECFFLPDDSSVCLTTGKYFFENDTFPHDKGIEPDHAFPAELSRQDADSINALPDPLLKDYISRLHDRVFGALR